MTIYKNEPVHSIDKHILRRKKRRIKQNKSIDMHGERETEHFELLRGFFTCYKLINPVCSVLLNYRSKTHLFFLLNNSLFPLVLFSFFFFVCLQFKRCNICLLWFSYIDFASKTDQKKHMNQLEIVCKENEHFAWTWISSDFRFLLRADIFFLGCSWCECVPRLSHSLSLRVPWNASVLHSMIGSGNAFAIGTESWICVIDEAVTMITQIPFSFVQKKWRATAPSKNSMDKNNSNE